MDETGIHLIYIPATDGRSDRVLEIIETNGVNDVLLEVQANPGSIAMQLDCDDMQDLPLELASLGF
jgi:hypothetical protein